MEIAYATREQIKDSLEIMETSRSDALIDSKLYAGARSINGALHRRFYPERRTVLMDWPSVNNGPTWQVDLGINEMISAETIVSGGATFAPGDYYLSRDDNRDEAPYSLLNINLNSSASFSSGSSFQRALSTLGLFGYSDVRSTAATLHGALNGSAATVEFWPLNGVLNLGVGSVVVLDTERMRITERRMVTSAQTLQSNLDDVQSTTSVAVSNGSLFGLREIIAIDAERMRVVNIVGNTLTVDRAFDGSVLSAHTAGATIYANRLFNVDRGVLGSTAAVHSDAATVYVQTYPALITELNIAETVVMLAQNSSAYARVVGSGPNQREASGKGLEDLRAQAYVAFGRKLRSEAI